MIRCLSGWCCALAVVFSSLNLARGDWSSLWESLQRLTPGPSDDVALSWNQVMLDASAIDSTRSSPDQGGPTRTSRAFAIVSVAMFDAWNSIHHKYRPYLVELSGYDDADVRAAITAAAHDALVALFPSQKFRFDQAQADWLRRIPAGPRRNRGLHVGRTVARRILEARANDGADAPMTYVPRSEPGYHQPDPLHPSQGFLGPQWGNVRPFVIRHPADYLPPPPPALDSPEYAADYLEVLLFGGDGRQTPTLRTREQTIIGVFWAYDGTPGLGTPPRLYNQIIRVIAAQRKNSLEQNVRLLALVNLAMADAGIQCWYAKYQYEFWRPIIAIRRGEEDGNPATEQDPAWTPLGAPATNGAGDGVNFTPPFPAYTSGHATFGAAALWTAARFYGTHRIPFRFMSDEFNGVNRNGDGSPRPRITRSYKTLDEAIWENAVSRIYLGIHWRVDADYGVFAGKRIAEDVAATALLPRRGRTK